MNDDDKILIVDDDEAIARLLSEILRSEGFSTRECLSGPAALEALAQDDFQLVLLDIMMPGMNGFETCQRIRENSDVPVVFLTAKNEESDLVLGFSLGADDYIVKPFKPRELVARVRTRIRRSKDRTVAKSPGLFDCDGLLIDTTRHVATLYDEELKLTPKEFGVLSLLARHAGKPVAIKDIFEEIWDEPYNSFDSNTVMVHIRRIRKKLSQVDSSREFIKTVFGVGYRLEVDRGAYEMARLKTEQARSMWTRLVLRYVLALLAFTIIYAVMLVTLGNGISRSLGNYIADSTSEWHYVSVDEFNDLMASGQLNSSNLQVIELGPYANYRDALGTGASATTGSAMSGEASTDQGLGLEDDAGTLTQDEKQKILQEGALPVEGIPAVAYRDLSTYNDFKVLKPLVAIVLYVLGTFIITLLFMRRPVRAVDSIADVLAAPGLVKGDAVELPKNLKSTQSEIELLQMRIVRDEMAARAAEERKNELATYLAHDIRTPLTSVRGYLELISEADGMEADRQREFAGRALAKANRLESLVEELFEITRYNMQNIPIEREELDVGLLCRQIAEEFYPQAQSRDLVVAVDAEEGLTAFWDSSRMGRVLENVLKNAMAHASADTKVLVHAAADDGTVTLSVSNRGKEIAPEHLEHIFDRFYRGDAARGQGTGGAGLGLAIAKEIVVAHGGSIEATSEDGLTTFTIRVPR